MNAPVSAATAWIDGGARGNPGPAAFGVWFEWNGRADEISGYLGAATNNVAEYSGLLAALTYARQNAVEDLQVYSDSELLVRQLSGAYRVRAANLLPYFTAAQRLRREFRQCRVEHVRREQNREADRLVNRAIDEREPLPPWLKLPA